MDVFDEEVLGRLGNVEVIFVVKGTLVKVPVILLGAGKWDSFGIECHKGINDELV